MSFVTPELFYVACAVPVLVLLLHLYDRARRRQLTRQLGELPVIGKVMASASPGRRVVKDVLSAAALTLVLVAAARPQRLGETDRALRGLDLAVAIDVSKSMLVDDVGPTSEMTKRRTETTRLARARELAVALIEVLPGDRVAPIVFAGTAAHMPPTEDHQVATRFLGDLGPNDLAAGSSIANVIEAARCLLRPDLYDDPDLKCPDVFRPGHGGDPLRGESLDPTSEEPAEAKLEQMVERGKALVIFTDGGDADEQTLFLAKSLQKYGIALFIVGIGTPGGGVVYEVDPMSGQRTTSPKIAPDGSTVTSKRDDAGMQTIVEAAGDARRYLIASERGEVDPKPIVDALRPVGRGLATKKIRDMQEVYQPFLFAAFMLLVIEAAIGTRRRRQYPEAR